LWRSRATLRCSLAAHTDVCTRDQVALRDTRLHVQAFAAAAAEACTYEARQPKLGDDADTPTTSKGKSKKSAGSPTDIVALGELFNYEHRDITIMLTEAAKQVQVLQHALARRAFQDANRTTNDIASAPSPPCNG
jgi:hypothetical protein